MFNVIIKTFIKDYNNTTNYKVRERYGIVCSVLSIICNTIMVIFKLIFGYWIHSVALLADGLNNLSDVGSNMATLFGFKLASKHPDSDHPYGHGRYEYIAGLVISFLILMVGFSSAKESLMKIIEPSQILFEWSAVAVIVVSIFIKLWMYYFNDQAGKMIESTSLKAAGQDSLNDVLTSSATLVSVFLSLLTDLPVDGIIGLIVSIIVLKSGVEIFQDTVNPLLGMAPNKELVDEIHEYVMRYNKVIGIHDFMMHDYGPGRKYLTFHAEVDSHEDIVEVHEQLDRLERDILRHFNILTTIHMDPIDITDERTLKLKMKVAYIVDEINSEYSIHDFRVVYGKTQSKLIFDVLIPSNDTTKHRIIRKQIVEKVKELDVNYHCVIQVEHSYI